MRIVLAYWWKGLKYAAMSLSAIYAGYVIQIKEIKEYGDLVSSDLGVLIIPALASACFFICYTVRFNPEESTDSDRVASSVELWKIALWTLVALAIPLAPFCLMVLASALGKRPSPWLISAFVIQVGMYAYYGYFLVKRLRVESTRALRHQLFWAVILSIGFSLYYGYTFSQLSVSLSPLIPVAAITGLFFVDWLSGLERRKFVKSMAAIFFVLTLTAVLAKTNVISIPFGENFYTMTLCVAVSIYMAVFEAWMVTSKVEQRRLASLTPDHPPTPFVDQKTFQYSAGTLSFLIVIIWIVPILFILSPYGGYFLLGFGIHAFFAFLIWYRFGLGKPLKNFKWGYLKGAMVLSFLAFLVSTKFFDTQPNEHFLAELVGLTPVFGFGACTFYAVKGLFKREHVRRRGDNKPNYLLIFTKRINFTRILSGMCFVAYVGLYLVLTLFGKRSPTGHYKGEMTLCFYGICIVLCAITELWHNHLFYVKPLMKRVIRYLFNMLFGILYVSRIVPSALLGLAVALPSLYSRLGIWQSCFSALPFFLSAIGAFALNDYYDIEKDNLNKPHRAIPSGKLSPKFVLWYAVTLIGLGLLSTFIFSRTKTEFILYVVCISGMTSYNLFVKYLSLSKTFLTATISSLPLLFSVIVFNYPMIYVLLPIAACSFILGREWLMDIRDVKGDAKGKIVTVPMIIGPGATTKLGFGLQLIAGFLLLPIAISSFSYWHFSLIAFVFLSTIGLYSLWSIGSGRFEQRVIRLLWIPMFCGLLFFIK